MRILGHKSNLRLLARRPMVLLRAYRWAVVFLLAAATADVVTTIPGVRAYGPATELHPAHRMMVSLLGPVAGPIVGKVFQVAFVVFVACLWRQWCGWILVLCGLFYAAAAVSNHFVLL
jgi:hypothetical protein